jgi:hypothetical protein
MDWYFEEPYLRENHVVFVGSNLFGNKTTFCPVLNQSKRRGYLSWIPIRKNN